MRKVFGCLFIVGTLLLLACGFFPLAESPAATMAAGGKRTEMFSSFTRLNPSDLFNCGSFEDLKCLPGIGETIASLVVAERETNGSFFYVEDILAVKGIGTKKLEQLRPFFNLVSGESEE